MYSSAGAFSPGVSQKGCPDISSPKLLPPNSPRFSTWPQHTLTQMTTATFFPFSWWQWDMRHAYAVSMFSCAMPIRGLHNRVAEKGKSKKKEQEEEKKEWSLRIQLQPLPHVASPGRRRRPGLGGRGCWLFDGHQLSPESDVQRPASIPVVAGPNRCTEGRTHKGAGGNEGAGKRSSESSEEALLVFSRPVARGSWVVKM